MHTAGGKGHSDKLEKDKLGIFSGCPDRLYARQLHRHIFFQYFLKLRTGIRIKQPSGTGFRVYHSDVCPSDSHYHCQRDRRYHCTDYLSFHSLRSSSYRVREGIGGMYGQNSKKSSGCGQPSASL